MSEDDFRDRTAIVAYSPEVLIESVRESRLRRVGVLSTRDQPS